MHKALSMQLQLIYIIIPVNVANYRKLFHSLVSITH